MSCLKGFVYEATTIQGRLVGFSHDPGLDLAYFQARSLTLLTPPLSAAYGHFLLEKLAGVFPAGIWQEPKGQVWRKFLDGFGREEGDPLQSTVASWLKRWGMEVPRPMTLDLAAPLPDKQELRRVKGSLEGRIYFLSELERALQQETRGQASGTPLEDILHILALQGEIQMMPAVAIDGEGKARCLRCGSTEGILISPCIQCGREVCPYCSECLPMGEARSCRPLYARSVVSRPMAEQAPHFLRWQVELTQPQREAGEKLLAWWDGGGDQSGLVWAACGAGKTEVAFPLIDRVLSQGGHVLFAIPRRDVVVELEPRLRRSFPGVPLTALYGGSPQRLQRAPLVVATTHQALRFYRNFDLVILDEADAFPYRDSPLLQRSLQRAMREGGRQLWMTATPGDGLLREVEKGRRELVSLPVRHHGYPLPEPRLVLEKSWRWEEDKRLLIPESILEFIHRSIEGSLAQILIFVPSVFLAQRVGEALKEAVRMPPFNDFTGDWVEFSHSRDPFREKKVRRFARGEFPILVSTSIMERGITLPKVHVLVLFAEKEQIYDEGALIQMAGRSGRSGLAPTGEVWFVGARVTGAMKGAVAKIRWLNREGARKGYLRSLAEPKEQQP